MTEDLIRMRFTRKEFQMIVDSLTSNVEALKNTSPDIINDPDFMFLKNMSKNLQLRLEIYDQGTKKYINNISGANLPLIHM